MDKIFKALSDKHRRLILTWLKEKEMGVSEIVERMDIGQATVSNHLAILKKANMVDVKVMGKKRIYKINVENICKFVKELNRFCDGTGISINDEIIVRR